MGWTVCLAMLFSFVLLEIVLTLAQNTKAGHCLPNDELIVKIEEGLIRGCHMKTRDGKDISSFRGIPYAVPPVDDLRFTAPVPVEPWTGLKDATFDAPMCIQKNYLIANPIVEGQEDCLYLNVYTTNLPSGDVDNIIETGRPVMVYIHGGGFFAGTGASYFNGPEYLLDEDVVLVTLNYRLGVLGFLSTGDDVAVGNWGLRDQILVLKWVQRNIARFGGNPKSVTIFGQSAGAASVHLLVLSPLTKGLFHRAISQSGSALNPWAVALYPGVVATMQAKFVNCSYNNSREIVDCLRKINASILVETGDLFRTWDVDPMVIYNPAVEKRTLFNPNPLIDDLPKNLIRQGKFHKVPYIMGVMKNEGIIRAVPIVAKSKLREDLNKRWWTLGPELLALPLSIVDKEKISEMWKNMTEFYMKNGHYLNESDPNNIQGFINMYSDRSFVYGMYQTAVMHAKFVPVYFYMIEYNGRFSYGPIFKATDEKINYNLTISHCDDLIYLFRAPALFPPTTDTDTDYSKVLVKLWTEFASTGRPLKDHWLPVSSLTGAPNRFAYLNMFGPTPSSKNGHPKTEIRLKIKFNFLPDRVGFWQNQKIVENVF